MQKFKHYFYQGSLILSGGCLVIMTLLILAQIIARAMNVIIPSSEDFAGWLLSATVFFGLAYTFNSGGHIRVSILLIRLNKNIRRRFEIFNLIIGLLISGFLAFYTFFTVIESFQYEEVTDTYLVVPLGVVQLPMALGSLFLFIAILDSMFMVLNRKTPDYLASECDLGGIE